MRAARLAVLALAVAGCTPSPANRLWININGDEQHLKLQQGEPPGY